MFFIALLVEISSDGGFSPPNPSVFSGIRLFILIYQKLQFYVELAQLHTYMRVLDDKVRKPHENPTIGILLCKSADRAFVEYVISDYNSPMGVATYKTADDMDERMRKSLPDMEEMRKLLTE